jgi:hypothetical protein
MTGDTKATQTSYYKLGNVCVCVCVSGYTFPHFSMDLLQIWREHYMDHDTYRGLLICLVHATCARAFAYFFTDSLQICWEHTTTHHKWQGLCTFDVQTPRTCVVKHSLIFGQILLKFPGHILQMTTSYMGYCDSYMYVSCSRTARLGICASLNGFSANLVGTYNRFTEVTRAI